MSPLSCLGELGSSWTTQAINSWVRWVAHRLLPNCTAAVVIGVWNSWLWIKFQIHSIIFATVMCMRKKYSVLLSAFLTNSEDFIASVSRRCEHWGIEGGSARIENPTSQEQSLKKRRHEQCVSLQKADALFRAVTVGAGGPGVTGILFLLPRICPLECVRLFAFFKGSSGIYGLIHG